MKHPFRNEFNATKRSLAQGTRKLQKSLKVLASVFMQPINALYAIVSATVCVLLALWFANLTLIQSVFDSSSLSLAQKIEFIFTMLPSVVLIIEEFQIALLLLFYLLWVGLGGLWVELLKIHNQHHRLRDSITPTLFFVPFIGALGILGISLFTPSLTRLGINVFVSEHYSGTLLTCFVIMLQLLAIKSSLKLLHRADKFNY